MILNGIFLLAVGRASAALFGSRRRLEPRAGRSARSAWIVSAARPICSRSGRSPARRRGCASSRSGSSADGSPRLGPRCAAPPARSARSLAADPVRSRVPRGRHPRRPSRLPRPPRRHRRDRRSTAVGALVAAGLSDSNIDSPRDARARRRRGWPRNRIAVENPADRRDDRDACPSSAPSGVRGAWSPPRARRSRAGRRSASRAAPRCCWRRAAGWSPTPSGWSRRSAARPAGRPTRRSSPSSPTGSRRSSSGPSRRPLYLADEEIESASPFVRGRRMVVRYAPLGVVGVIGPWNYPLNNSFGDCIPALAAGNAVVLKPSEVTPLTSLLMAEMLAECGLPEGVFQVATGRGETGAALVDAVDFVMFTGSVETGKKVMAQAAQTLTPVEPRARRQGPDDRARRRRPRAGRERRRLLRAQQLGPGLHLGRADLRRGAGPRRVRRPAHREGRRPAPGPARRGRARSTSARSSSGPRSS